MSDPYKNYSRVYDRHTGERDEIPVIKNLIKKHQPEAETILEFACGTGAILAPLSANYIVNATVYASAAHLWQSPSRGIYVKRRLLLPVLRFAQVPA